MRSEYVINQEMEHVLAALTPSNRLVMMVCLQTGLRVGDVVSLTTAQVSKSSRFWIREQKTSKPRYVVLPESLRSKLLQHSGKTWIFPGRDASTRSHRTRQAVWADVKRASKAFRLAANVTPHSARKAYAVNMLEKYGDITKVQKALNHSSSEVTLLYAIADKLVGVKGLKPAKNAQKSRKKVKS